MMSAAWRAWERDLRYNRVRDSAANHTPPEDTQWIWGFKASMRS